MKIEEFIRVYKGKNEKDREALLKKHIVREYMPFEDKVAEADKIIKSALYKDGKFEVHSAIVEELFALSVIARYTDIEMDDLLTGYNLLEENGINEFIEAIIHDVRKFRGILDMMIADEKEKHSLVPFLSEQFEAFKLSFDEMKKGMN